MFTVSFDVPLDIRILPLSGKEDTLHWISSLSDLSPTDLAEEMEILKAFQFKYPGICALNFERLLDIVFNKLVGDNDLKTGIFGKLAAYGLAVEEQGRKTLHAHILVYMVGWKSLLWQQKSQNQRIRRRAEKEIEVFVDSCLSTELVPNSCKDMICLECKQHVLQFIEPQDLRFLHHKVGCKVHNGTIAKCLNCGALARANEIALKKALPDMETIGLSKEEVQATVSYNVLKACSPLHSTPIPGKSIGIINWYN